MRRRPVAVWRCVRALLVLGLVALLGCRRAPREPPDPCPALLATYEATRTHRACATAQDCVAAPGIVLVPQPAGVMGRAPARAPCGSATHRDSLGALDAVVTRWRAASCGPVGPPGSRQCSGYTHGARVSCIAGQCEGVF